MRLPTTEVAINWSRLAEPQEDQYDTEVVLQLACSTVSAARPEPYTRSPPGENPTVFDGAVAIRHVYRLPQFRSLSARYADAPVDHPNIPRAVDYVRRWPTVFLQCKHLLEAIHPVIDKRYPLLSKAVYRGSSSHSYERLFGTLWATVTCPLGLAEAIVHEMAHQKLRALGVSIESATRIVGNDARNLYVSPIVKDRLRPMTAVLHAEYSYVHVTALDVCILEAEADPHRCHLIGRRLAVNLARIKEGIETLRDHLEPGRHGEEFMQGMFAWAEHTIGAGERLLRAKSSS